MAEHPDQSWPITPESIFKTLPVARLVEIAAIVRVPLARSPSWDDANRVLLRDSRVETVALLHMLTRFELGAICRLVSISDQGPTQSVIAQLLPLCLPSRPSGRHEG